MAAGTIHIQGGIKMNSIELELTSQELTVLIYALRTKAFENDSPETQATAKKIQEMVSKQVE